MKSTRNFNSFSGGMYSSVTNAGTSRDSRRILPCSSLGMRFPSAVLSASYTAIETAVGIERELRVLGEQVLAQYPMRIEHEARLEFMPVAVFNDAAHLNIGHGEGLGEPPDPSRLYDWLLVHGAVEFDDAPIRVDGPCLNAVDALRSLVEGNLNVRVLTAFLGQNFDASVHRFARSVVIPVDLPVQENRRRSQGLGLTGHFELVRRNRQPVLGSPP